MSELSLIFNPPFFFGYLIIAAIVLGGLTVFLYGRRWRVKRFRWLLVIAGLLRISVLLALIFMLTRPQLLERRQTEKLPRLAVVLDASVSMNLPHDNEKQKQLSRWQVATQTLLSGQKQKLFRHYRTNFYLFGEDLKPFGIKALSGLSPTHTKTDLVNVFQQLYFKDGYEELAAVLIFTDGQDTTRRQPQKLLASLKKLSRPVFSVSLGSKVITDARIASVHALKTAYLNHPLDISVTLGNNGLPAQQVTLTLWEEERRLLEQEAMLPADGQLSETKLTFTPRKVGWHKYRIAFEPGALDVVPRNNTAVFYLKVIKEKLDVLLLSGAPDWELSFLSRFLESEANLEVTSLFLGLKEKFFYRGKEAAAALAVPLPLSFTSQLQKYDLVIVKNLAFAAIGQAFAAALEEKIDRGGSLILIGGPAAFGRGYEKSALAKLSPLVIEPEEYVNEETYLRLVPQWSSTSKLTAATEGWKTLPFLDGYNKVARLKPGAEMIAYNSENKKPLIARQYYGLGKVTAVAVSGTWRWHLLVKAFDDEIEPYHRFWRELVSWTLTFKDESPFILESDRHVYQLGEAVKLTLKVKAPQEKNSYTGQLIKSGEPSSKIGFSRTEGKVFQAQIHSQKTGDYYVKAGQAEVRFTVILPQEEFLKPAADPATWKLLAFQSGGEVIKPERLPAEIGKLPAKKIINEEKRRTRLLDLWQIFLLVVIFLGIEWLLQKIVGID